MRILLITACLLAYHSPVQAQLSIEKIMADPKISVGALPSDPFWSEDSKTIYFNWNPELESSNARYAFPLSGGTPYKVSLETRQALPAISGTWNRNRSQKLYTKNGDLFLMDISSMQTRALTNTSDYENNLGFSADETQVYFAKSNNIYAFSLSAGALRQVTNFRSGSADTEDSGGSDQDKWLKKDQMSVFDVLNTRAEKRKQAEKKSKAEEPKRPREIFLNDKRLEDLQISPDGRFVSYQLTPRSKNEKSTIVPNYVTETGFTEDIPGRTKVGAAQSNSEFWIFDTQRDTALQISTQSLEGITDQPAFLREYQSISDTTQTKKKEARKVDLQQMLWSDDSRYAVMMFRSMDNKDRWIVQLDTATITLKTLEHLHDEAWINSAFHTIGFLPDRRTLYYQSEADGYAHLYTIDVSNGEKTQLTKGPFEVQQVQASRDGQFFYLMTNEIHPGEQQYYRMSVKGGERTRLTQKSGAYQVVRSPDDTKLAYLYSTTNQPWELFVQDNSPSAEPVQITYSQSPQFKSYAWRIPKIITIPAKDGALVYARLYEGSGKKGKKPAVIFVHGAGYLQNAHRWWSTYFREYMFHNFLVDQGYTVLDMDYRGSSGYGRDWRTGIYRFMGGKDLDDQVDGAQWLVKNQGIDPKRIGIYGGSYGGFITLMAMFTKPGVFQSGAALRPVTDWAAYNHPYTSNILNQPQNDSLAYRRSSPIYHAEGLQGHLLMCHGMIDGNVHYQDVVRLSQRLIELKKENWELASYPLEDHGFVEPTSWMDEYKRIFRLFEQTLKF